MILLGKLQNGILLIERWFKHIKARHIFGAILIALAIAITARPTGTVNTITTSYGITPIVYATIIAISGTLLIVVGRSLWLRYLFTIPFILYLDGTLTRTLASETRPYTVITLYMGLYILVLYFMTREDE